MARTVMFFVSDDFQSIQKARNWAQDSGVELQVYSNSQWNGGLGNPTFENAIRTEAGLAGGTQNGGAKVLPFPTNTTNKKVASMEELESQAIVNAIHEYRGNLTEAAKALGIGRATLYRKVKQYNIDPALARNKTGKAA